MFLTELSEIEKRAFASLSYHAAMANGILAVEESKLIEEYCKEMNIHYFSFDSADDLKDIEKVFISSTDRIKKIVVFELFGVMYSDGKFDLDEDVFIRNFSKEIGIETETIEAIKKMIDDYYHLVEIINSSLM